MDQQINQPYVEIAKLFDGLFKAANISGPQKDKVIQNLENAVMLNAMAKLISKLPESEASHLETMDFKTPEDIASYFKSFVSPEDFNLIVSQSARSVISDFLENIK